MPCLFVKDSLFWIFLLCTHTQFYPQIRPRNNSSALPQSFPPPNTIGPSSLAILGAIRHRRRIVDFLCSPDNDHGKKRSRTTETLERKVNVSFCRGQIFTRPSHLTASTPILCQPLAYGCPGHGTHPHRYRPARSDKLPPEQRPKI